MVVYRQDRRRRLTLVLLVLTSLVLVTLDERGSGTVVSFRDAAQDAFSPVQDLASDAFSPVTDFFDGLGRADELEAENARLRRENAELHARVAAGQEARTRYDELAALVDLPNLADVDGVVANVVDGATGNFERTFQIDKGTASGIAKGMAVVVGADGGALVGQVVGVSRSRAIVRRLDDPRFSVAVQLLQPEGGTGPVALVGGRSDSALLVLELTSSGARLSRGQLAITRGLGASPFPRGLVVGTVVRDVEPTTAQAERAALRPVVDLDRLTVVKVLRYQPEPAP